VRLFNIYQELWRDREGGREKGERERGRGGREKDRGRKRESTQKY
jgi:hypothetical protein